MKPIAFQGWMLAFVVPALVACGGGRFSDQTDDGDLPDGFVRDLHHDTGKDKGGEPQKLTWPAERLVVTGAHAPALAIAGGTVLLAYAREDGKMVLRAGAETGAEVLLSTRTNEEGATLSSRSFPKIAGDPSSRHAVVLWSWGEADLRMAWWKDDVLEITDASPINLAGLTIYSWLPARNLNLAWTDGGPLAALQSNEPAVQLQNPDGTWAQPQLGRDVWYALKVPRATDAPVLWPDATVELFNYAGGMYLGFGEAPSLVPLASRPEWGTGPAALVAPSFMATKTEGDITRFLGMNWAIARQVPGSAARNGSWLEPVTKGHMEVVPDPEYKSWIQLHPLGPDNGILTYCRPDGGTAVYDVFAQRYVLSAEGVPSVEGEAINVSETFGGTDGSEYPVVLPTGDGRWWIAWRESEFGPRVALYDALMNRVGIATPDVDLHQNEAESVAAAVDANGALHLAAVVNPSRTQGNQGLNEVRYWVLERP
jgi:hypothetical protein